ncbi:helix-turn-helix transcriptional regulator [Entomomonas sp. E2T0]|uniref:helix-turn-helix transcriptional regulator n=1 Tax=Entomomonas sp. E2T0 TaxID=2930213 RepID=UPI0022280E84|nr:helix-turn-helix transcriptional regulator [Entomomonas sp. E2T0]UYZ83176.1 helix-turn-helix transcriptional regulator [Entomomonas sp. E2T0]
MPLNNLLNKLTKREREICILLINGYPAKQVGFELGIAEPTVKSLTTNIFNKLGINNKTQLVSFVFTDFIKNIANNSFSDPVEAANQFLISLQVKPT